MGHSAQWDDFGFFDEGDTQVDGRISYDDSRVSRIESYGRFVSRGPATDLVSGQSEPATLRDGAVTSVSDAPLLEGDRVGPFVIEATIGRGSFGTVYRARAPRGTKVAVKVLDATAAQTPEIVARFEYEAEAARRVCHPNVVQVYGVGRLRNRRPFIVMELLSGTSLDRYLARRGRLSLSEALPVLRGIASAIDAAHRAGVAHRDLKPANVFLAQTAHGLSPKLLDFGIAKELRPRRKSWDTDIGVLMGTPEYMSPEQCSGEAVDGRADVYAFGILTFEVLVGRVPFRSKNPIEVLRRHVVEKPEHPSGLVPELPASIDDLIGWLLEKRPNHRPERLSPLIDVLDAVLEAAV